MSSDLLKFFLIVFFALPSRGATLDQSFLPADSTGSPGSIFGLVQGPISAQVYTAGLNGTLAGVTLDVYSMTAFISFDYPLEVEILAVTGGVPNGTILGYTTLATSYTDLSSLITFPQTIPQVAGIQYAITEFYPSAPTFSNSYDGWGAVVGTEMFFAPPLYAGGYVVAVDGTSWSTYDSEDEYFSTYVDTSVQPAPEPGSLCLVAIAGLGVRKAFAHRRSCFRTEV